MIDPQELLAECLAGIKMACSDAEEEIQACQSQIEKCQTELAWYEKNINEMTQITLHTKGGGVTRETVHKYNTQERGQMKADEAFIGQKLSNAQEGLQSVQTQCNVTALLSNLLGSISQIVPPPSTEGTTTIGPDLKVIQTHTEQLVESMVSIFMMNSENVKEKGATQRQDERLALSSALNVQTQEASISPSEVSTHVALTAPVIIGVEPKQPSNKAHSSIFDLATIDRVLNEIEKSVSQILDNKILSPVQKKQSLIPSSIAVVHLSLILQLPTYYKTMQSHPTEKKVTEELVTEISSDQKTVISAGSEAPTTDILLKKAMSILQRTQSSSSPIEMNQLVSDPKTPVFAGNDIAEWLPLSEETPPLALAPNYSGLDLNKSKLAQLLPPVSKSSEEIGFSILEKPSPVIETADLQRPETATLTSHVEKSPPRSLDRPASIVHLEAKSTVAATLPPLSSSRSNSRDEKPIEEVSGLALVSQSNTLLESAVNLDVASPVSPQVSPQVKAGLNQMESSSSSVRTAELSESGVVVQAALEEGGVKGLTQRGGPIFTGFSASEIANAGVEKTAEEAEALSPVSFTHSAPESSQRFLQTREGLQRSNQEGEESSGTFDEVLLKDLKNTNLILAV